AALVELLRGVRARLHRVLDQAGADRQDERERPQRERLFAIERHVESLISNLLWGGLIRNFCVRLDARLDVEPELPSVRATCRRRKEVNVAEMAGLLERSEQGGRIVGVADDAQGRAVELDLGKMRAVRERTRERLQHDHARGSRLLRLPGSLW